MISEQRRKWWPALAAPALVGAVALGGGIAADAGTDLPDKTADEVLAMVAAHDDASFSGRFEVAFALGLPQTPGTDGGGPGRLDHGPDVGADAGRDGLAELFALLSGTHEARVFADGPDRARVQVFDGTEERNIVRNGDEIWAYDSARNTAAHAVVPGDSGHGPASRHRGGGFADGFHEMFPGGTTTPDRLAGELLAGLDPSTQVTVGQDTRVAGRDAYTLRLDPRTEDTLVEGVTLAVDAATGTPLSVRVDAVGQEAAAISVGFTTFSPETPDRDLFDFTPPEGAEVEQLRPGGERHGPGTPDGNVRQGSPESGVETVHGTGWDAVVAIPAAEVPEDLAALPLLDQYATDTEAGRVLSTPLATVLLTDDGRVFAGTVPLERLLDVAEAG